MKVLILRLIIGGLILIIINPMEIYLAHSSLLNNSTLPCNQKLHLSWGG